MEKDLKTQRGLRLLQVEIAALATEEILEKGDSYYFVHLLLFFRSFSEEELQTIILWIDKNVIDNKRLFINAMVRFVENVNWKKYYELVEVVRKRDEESSARSPAINPEIRIWKTGFKSRPGHAESKKNRGKKNGNVVVDLSNGNLKLHFFEWVEKRIINECSFGSKYEEKNKDKICDWLENHINSFNKRNIAGKKTAKSKTKKKIYVEQSIGHSATTKDIYSGNINSIVGDEDKRKEEQGQTEQGGQGSFVGKGKKKKYSTLLEVWNKDNHKDLNIQLSLLEEKNYLGKKEDGSYFWLGKGWKQLAAITEIWKDANYFARRFSKFGSQRELCFIVCLYLGLSEKEAQSVYSTGFKPNIISYDDKLTDSMLKEKKRIKKILSSKEY